MQLITFLKMIGVICCPEEEAKMRLEGERNACRERGKEGAGKEGAQNKAGGAQRGHLCRPCVPRCPSVDEESAKNQISHSSAAPLCLSASLGCFSTLRAYCLQESLPDKANGDTGWVRVGEMCTRPYVSICSRACPRVHLCSRIFTDRMQQIA